MTQPPAPSAPPVIPVAEPAPAVPTVPPAPPATPATPAAEPAAPIAGEKVEDLPEWAQKIISGTRKEAGDARAAAKKAAEDAKNELTQSLGKALGLVKDEAIDPAELASTLTATQQENRLLKVQMALGAATAANGADTALTTAVLAHEGKLAQLDPTAADFGQQLDALVKAAVAANPKLKGTLAVPASGTEFTGGPGDTADIDQQIAEAAKQGNHALAIQLKRQKAYAAQG